MHFGLGRRKTGWFHITDWIENWKINWRSRQQSSPECVSWWWLCSKVKGVVKVFKVVADPECDLSTGIMRNKSRSQRVCCLSLSFVETTSSAFAEYMLLLISMQQTHCDKCAYSYIERSNQSASRTVSGLTQIAINVQQQQREQPERLKQAALRWRPEILCVLSSVVIVVV